MQAGYRWQTSIVGDEGLAARYKRCHELQRVRRLDAGSRTQLRGSPQLVTCHVAQPDTPAPRQQRLIAFGQLPVAGSIRHDQHLQQCQRRGHELPSALICLSEQRRDDRQEDRVFLDEPEPNEI